MNVRQRLAVAAAVAAAVLAAAVPCGAGEGVKVSVVGDRLTVHAEGVPLRDVLQELGRATGATIVGLAAIGQEQASVAVADLPLVQAVQRILRGRSFVLELARTDGRDRLARVRLLGATSPREDAAAAPVMYTPTAPTEPWGVPTGDPEERLEAAGIFAQHADATLARSVLEDTLATDPDPNVRRAALHGLLAGGLLDPNLVLKTADADGDPDVRLEASRMLSLYDVVDIP